MSRRSHYLISPHMPLVELELIGQAALNHELLARHLADALGGIFRSSPGQTWVRIRGLAATAYAENGSDLPSGTEPAFVTITKHRLPEGDALEEEARRISEVVASLCGLPQERVHIIYEPPGKDRIAFGGRVVR